MSVTHNAIVRILQLNAIHADIISQLKLESALMDFCGDYIITCLPHVISLLYKALGHRVTLITAKPLPDVTVIFVSVTYSLSLTYMISGVTTILTRSSRSESYWMWTSFYRLRALPVG